jgi:hypothetical protein
MNKKNTEKLLKDFPNLYKQYYLSPDQTCMCWGFGCGDGWFNILYKLSVDLEMYNPSCEIAQVKEKFGSLRVYADDLNADGSKIIEWAEKMSSSICEECGKPGKIDVKQPYYKCLCKKCKDKRK